MANFSMKKVTREVRPEPYELELSDGTVITLNDPKRLPFKSLAGMDESDPLSQIRVVAGGNTDVLLNDPEFDTEAVEQLIESWQEYYEVNQGN